MEHSKKHAIQIAVIITLVTMGLLFANAELMPSGALQKTFENVLNTVLALGLVGLVYEVFLRDLVFRETVETIKLQSDVAESALSAIDRATAIDWSGLLEQADAVSVIVANPMGWIERDWNHLLTAAKKSRITINIYLPRLDENVAIEAARRLGYEAQLFSEQAGLLRTSLESGWKTARQQAQGPVKGSQFRLAVYDFVPAYEIAVTQHKACLLIPEVGAQVPGGERLRLTFSRRRGSFPADWLIEHVDALGDLPADYADEVK